MSDCALVEPLSAPDVDAAYRWLLAICSSWLARRAGACPDGDPQPPPCRHAIETMAYVHGVEPILHARIKESTALASLVPTDLQERWERAYYTTRLRNTGMLDLLSRILAACDASRVDVLVLKGPAAMAAVHRDVGLRPMADLDVLCRPRDLPVAASIARSLGFSRTGQPYLHQVDLYNAAEDVLLELHFDGYYCMTGSRAFLDSAWRDQATASVEDWHFPVMSHEHQVVFDVAHTVNDGLEVALKHVVDLAGRLMPCEGGLRADTVHRLAVDAGLGDVLPRLVGAIQRLVGLSFGVPLPGVVDEAATPRFIDAVVERSQSIGLAQKRRVGGEFARQPGIARKTRLAWKRLFPPLPALQASYALPSIARTVPYAGLHAGRTLVDVARRLRSERRPAARG